MKDFNIVREVWKERNWPGVEESTSYGTPALKVRGKLLVRWREPGVLVLICELDEKDFLKEANPEVYFETDHYKGYPAILVRSELISRQELGDMIERVWCRLATRKMLSEYRPTS